MERTRVFVVGMGVITPIGLNVTDMWNNLLHRVTGTGLNTFNTYRRATGDLNPAYKELTNLVTAELKGFDPADWMDRKTVRREDPFCWFALAAAEQAVSQAMLLITPEMQDRIAVVMGSGVGGLTTLEDEHTILMQKGPDRVSPFLVTRLMQNAASSLIARRFNCSGPSITLVSACATGVDTIGEASELIRNGHADAAIAGGSEAAITPLSISAFKNMNALTTRTDNPKHQSRPFDKDRNGFVMGEGAGAVVLASLAFIEEHGLVPLAEVAGYARTQDAYHITAPHPQGLHATRAIRLALKNAGISSDHVTYINPHGTGTQINDPIEAHAIESIFGDRVGCIPISSSKSMLGHMLGAAGAVESIICVMTLLEKKAHPAANLDVIDPQCRALDHILKEPRNIPRGAVLKTALGFGGSNAAIVFLPV
ncbi:MAG: beta-ketoacyl-ACP synthase II [bacterium]|nr:beta-ketoacyl-ACP synthase II [bacterium]